jgi:hypothetical protein
MTPEELIGRSLLDVAMDQAEARFTLENDQQVIAGRIIQTFKDQTYTDRFGIIHWLEVNQSTHRSAWKNRCFGNRH